MPALRKTHISLMPGAQVCFESKIRALFIPRKGSASKCIKRGDVLSCLRVFIDTWLISHA